MNVVYILVKANTLSTCIRLPEKLMRQMDLCLGFSCLKNNSSFKFSRKHQTLHTFFHSVRFFCLAHTWIPFRFTFKQCELWATANMCASESQTENTVRKREREKELQRIVVLESLLCYKCFTNHRSFCWFSPVRIIVCLVCGLAYFPSLSLFPSVALNFSLWKLLRW